MGLLYYFYTIKLELLIMSLKLNEQYDYITLKTPNGNFTMNRNGFKASGEIPMDVFNKLTKYVNNFKGTPGEAMKSLLDEKIMASIWPDFNKVTTYDFKVGETVVVKDYPKYGSGKILELKKKAAKILFSQG